MWIEGWRCSRSGFPLSLFIQLRQELYYMLRSALFWSTARTTSPFFIFTQPQCHNELPMLSKQRNARNKNTNKQKQQLSYLGSDASPKMSLFWFHFSIFRLKVFWWRWWHILRWFSWFEVSFSNARDNNIAFLNHKSVRLRGAPPKKLAASIWTLPK